MRTQRFFPAMLAGAVLCLAPVGTARAEGEAGSRADQEDYQRREAASTGVEQFEGGDAIVTVAVIAAIVLVVYFVIRHHDECHHHGS